MEAVVFNGNIKKEDVTELLTEVVELGLNGGSKKWEPLLFSNHKKARRDDLARTYLESKLLPPAPTTAAVSAASATMVLFPVTPHTNNNNNNNITPGADNSTSVAPSPTAVLYTRDEHGSFHPYTPTPLPPTIISNNNNRVSKRKLKPLEQWKVMEEHIHKTICDEENNETTLATGERFEDDESTTESISSVSSKGCTTSDRYLVLQVMIWMMEIFPPLMCTPFLLAREKSILDKADAELVALYRSDEAHSLANAIEEKVDAGVDTKSDDNNNNPHHQNNIRSNMMNPNNKRNRNGKRKNFNGESGTTPETNALGAEKKNHQKGQQKQKKAKRSKKKQHRSDKGSAPPYAGNNKKNHVQTPAESGGRHRFNKGGKQLHQSCNPKNRRSRNRNGRGGGK